MTAEHSSASTGTALPFPGARGRSSVSYDFRLCKACNAPEGVLTFHLERALVYVCAACGFHYTNHLDPIEHLSFDVDRKALTRQQRAMIETHLHSSEERLERHVALIEEHLDPAGAKVLDIGSGGGRFLAKLKASGARVFGIELDDVRVKYTTEVHGIETVKYPVEHAYWQRDHAGTFDAITMWDVIEHVNFPVDTLHAAARLLKPGGLLLLDTPMRDGVYHRFGVLSYRLSRGRLPTFLNLMYSNQAFGHKQILSREDLRRFLALTGFELVALRSLHELSYPYRFYLEMLLKSARLADLAHAPTAAFFKAFKLRNKMIAVARRSSSET